MSERLQALREKRAVRAKTLNELVNKDGWNTEVDTPIYDQGMAELDSLDAQIQRIQDTNTRLATDALTNSVIEAGERVGQDKRSEVSRLFARSLRVGIENLTAEERQVFQATMSVGTGSQGGYTVPTEIAKSILDALKAFGGMRRVANVIQTAGGNPINFPTSDGTSETGELIAENVTATALDPTMGSIALNVYKFSSKIIAVPFELLQDSAVDIEAWVRGRMVTRLGRTTNQYFTTGTGSAQPQGLAYAATTGKTGASGQTVTVIYDDLIDLQHSVDAAYRELGNCGWMMNDDSIRILRKLKDAYGRPIFAPGYEDSLAVGGPSGGAPDRILGAPITVNNQMAVMAAGAKSILYGDFSYYTIRDAMMLEMFRFTDSAYAKLGQVGFLAWMRSGGALIDVGGAVKAYVNAAS